MAFLDKIKFIKHQLERELNTWELNNSEEYELDRKAGDLIRITHSIEKGLCISNPRLGFGHEKQEKMMALIQELENSDSKYYMEARLMAEGALKCYVDYHDEKGFSDEMIVEIKSFLKKRELPENILEYGGCTKIKKNDMLVSTTEIEKLFNTRHSIRNFSDEEVDHNLLRKAIILAQRAPSACNRQGVRVYVINHKDATVFKEWMNGTGGFEQAIKEFVLITAKRSVYMPHEINQYIVSASMYAAYLSLALHAYGLGACVVQRSVVINEKWERIRKILDIPGDEQAICLLGIGNLKDEYCVPVSHRLSEEVFVKFYK